MVASLLDPVLNMWGDVQTVERVPVKWMDRPSATEMERVSQKRIEEVSMKWIDRQIAKKGNAIEIDKTFKDFRY